MVQHTLYVSVKSPQYPSKIKIKNYQKKLSCNLILVEDETCWANFFFWDTLVGCSPLGKGNIVNQGESRGASGHLWGDSDGGNSISRLDDGSE